MLGKEKKILNKKIFLLYCLNLRTEATMGEFFKKYSGYNWLTKKEEATVVPPEAPKENESSDVTKASKELIREEPLDNKEEFPMVPGGTLKKKPALVEEEFSSRIVPLEVKSSEIKKEPKKEEPKVTSSTVVASDKKKEPKKEEPKVISSTVVISSLDETKEKGFFKSCLNLFKGVASKKFSEVLEYMKSPNKSLIPEYEWIENLKKNLKEKCPWLDSGFLKIGLLIGSIFFSYFSGDMLLTSGYIIISSFLNYLHDIFINRKQYKDNITCSEFTKILASEWEKSSPNEISNWNAFFKTIQPLLSIMYWYFTLNFDKCPSLVVYEASDLNYAALEFASKCSEITIPNAVELIPIIPLLNHGIINNSFEEKPNNITNKKEEDKKKEENITSTPNNRTELEEINRKQMKLKEQLHSVKDPLEIKKIDIALNELVRDEQKIQINSENLTSEEKKEKEKKIDYNLKEANLKIEINTAENSEKKKEFKKELIKLKENKLKNLQEKILEKKKINENTDELEKERDNEEFLLNKKKIENDIDELENNKETNLEAIMKKIENLENLVYEKEKLQITNKIKKIKEDLENKEGTAKDQLIMQIKNQEERLKDLEGKHKVKILKEQINYLKKNKSSTEKETNLLKEKEKQLDNLTNETVTNQKKPEKGISFKLPLIVIIGAVLIYFGINSGEDQEEIQI